MRNLCSSTQDPKGAAVDHSPLLITVQVVLLHLPSPGEEIPQRETKPTVPPRFRTRAGRSAGLRSGQTVWEVEAHPAWRDLAKSAVNRGGMPRAETPGFWSYSLASDYFLAPRTKLQFTELWQTASVHGAFMMRRFVVLECGCAGWFYLKISMPWKLQWDSSSVYTTVNSSPLDSAPSVAGQSSSFRCLSAVNCSDRAACRGAVWKLPQVFRDREPHQRGGSEILSKT